MCCFDHSLCAPHAFSTFVPLDTSASALVEPVGRTVCTQRAHSMAANARKFETVCFKVPVYLKQGPIYVLTECLTKEIACGVGLARVTSGAEIGRRMLVGLIWCVCGVVCTGETTSLAYTNSEILKVGTNYRPWDLYHERMMCCEDSPDVLASYHTLLICEDSRRRVHKQSVFDHHRVFKASVPACRMHQYMQDLCALQNESLNRLMKRITKLKEENGTLHNGVSSAPRTSAPESEGRVGSKRKVPGSVV